MVLQKHQHLLSYVNGVQTKIKHLLYDSPLASHNRLFRFLIVLISLTCHLFQLFILIMFCTLLYEWVRSPHSNASHSPKCFNFFLVKHYEKKATHKINPCQHGTAKKIPQERLIWSLSCGCIHFFHVMCFIACVLAFVFCLCM